MRPKAAATPAATIPEPYSPPKANIVAAAPVEVEVVADATGVLEGEPVEEGADEAELELEGDAVAKSEILACPQYIFSSASHLSWVALTFAPAMIQF
jgi:hypothetical protein